MRPPLKRTILTSKKDGRRYFVVRSAHRPNGRRYYVCSQAGCQTRLTREADLYCPTHTGSTTDPHQSAQGDLLDKFDDLDEEVLNDHSEILDEESSMDDQNNATFESNQEENDEHDHPHDNQESSLADDFSDLNETDPNSMNNSTSFVSKRMKYNREIDVDQSTGSRSFRDQTGRRRFLCSQPGCTNMLKRQSDVFCRRHVVYGSANTSIAETATSLSPAPLESPDRSQEATNRFRSPFSVETASTIVKPSNGNHADEQKPARVITTNGTNRSFRDTSGRIRFLCSNPTCHRRVPRRSETFCKRHQPDLFAQVEYHSTPKSTNDLVQPKKEHSTTKATDLNHNTTDLSSQSKVIGSSAQLKNVSNKIVIATTTLLDDQWSDVLQFLRQYPHVQLSTNLNVTNSTTHLLIDDSENHLHCTITKKIVQAAVRRHVFILSCRWISECLRCQTFVDEHPFEIISDTHTTLRLSRQDFQVYSKDLFDRNVLKRIYGFAIECRQCQGSINRNELIELIQLTGGKFFEHDQTMDVLIVLCDINERSLDKIQEKYLQLTIPTIKYVTSDFLLKSIIKFEIQDIDKYSL